GKRVALHINIESFSRSVHAPVGCTACHSDVTQIPHAAEPKRVQCSTCHPAAFEVYAQSVHGRAKAKGDRDAATCSDCHGSHDVLPKGHLESRVNPLNLPRTCGGCHGDPELAKRHGIPIANVYQLYMDSIHGRALMQGGLLVAANCSSCHGSHGIVPAADPKSTVHKSNIPETCGRCHAGVLRVYADSVHGKAAKRGNPIAPVCIDCHSAHEIRRVEMERWRLEIVRECGTCHAQSLRTFRDTFHGQVTTLGFTRVARCSDCHGAHDILPKSDPRSTVAPNRIVTTCRKCHAQANANFAKYDPHADAADRARNPVLYYTARFMTWLLAGVFLFFGFHTALWAGRPLFARFLKKRASEKDKDNLPGPGGEGGGEQDPQDPKEGSSRG
ncbi:MAG: cytochrome c3 family protein, partial [Deltaproteobacteria bacterium]|nr:cytochrome c3 family protein [Deltaproteobacteria bacterium]